MGILVTAAAAIILAIFFDLSAIASIGSAVALVVFTLVTFGHLRIRRETGAQAWLLVLANVTTVVVLVAFAFTTLGGGARDGGRAGRDPGTRHRARSGLEAPSRRGGSSGEGLGADNLDDQGGLRGHPNQVM